MQQPEQPATPAPRKHRWLKITLLVLAALALLVALTLQWLLRPATFTTFVLDEVGNALGLEITASGIGEYRLRGQPQIVVREVIARQPGQATPLFSAKRVLLSLPWNTLQTRGQDLTITHVELDAPMLDLQALTRWQATRPPSAEVRIPHLTDGLSINNGRLLGDGWSVRAINVSLPRLAERQALDARLSGRFEDAGTRVPFDVALKMSAPTADASISAIGPLFIERDDWRIHGALNLRGRLDMAEGSSGLSPATVGYAGQWQGGEQVQHLRIGMRGPFKFSDGVASFGWQRLLLRGDGADSAIPNLDARGAFALGQRLVLRIHGTLPQWPANWPSLPAPLQASTSPLPLRLDYLGPSDLSGSTTLHLQRDATSVDARLRLPVMLGWMDGDAGLSPLPPLEARVSSPLLEVGGVQLHGVELELSEDEDR